MTFEHRIGIDIGMNFHVNVIPIEQIAQLIGNFYTSSHLYQHSFFDRIDKNIKELVEIFNRNEDKLNANEQELITKIIGLSSTAIPRLKEALFKSLQK